MHFQQNFYSVKFFKVSAWLPNNTVCKIGLKADYRIREARKVAIAHGQHWSHRDRERDWRSVSFYSRYPRLQGQICDILRPQLAMNRFLPLWPHRFPHSGYLHLGGGAWGGSDIRSMSSIRPICKCRCPPLDKMTALLVSLTRPVRESNGQQPFLMFLCLGFLSSPFVIAPSHQPPLNLRASSKTLMH